jgi:hypothetical protein
MRYNKIWKKGEIWKKLEEREKSLKQIEIKEWDMKEEAGG